eukprot:TRINITY_DN1898_c0_g1_i6.p1 TRINITY_DN1898_c0_g1~~TRINITY_DN1898_c0_g1_i6.p1  ORF type:complete len:212 (+),score=44.34 TRINITY_DN1898_c0_g1_i6:237-872(+)
MQLRSQNEQLAEAMQQATNQLANQLCCCVPCTVRPLRLRTALYCRCCVSAVPGAVLQQEAGHLGALEADERMDTTAGGGAHRHEVPKIQCDQHLNSRSHTRRRCERPCCAVGCCCGCVVAVCSLRCCARAALCSAGQCLAVLCGAHQQCSPERSLPLHRSLARSTSLTDLAPPCACRRASGAHAGSGGTWVNFKGFVGEAPSAQCGAPCYL